LVGVVGIVMVVALLTLPAATAGMVARRLWQMMAISIVLCALFMTGGLALSFERDLPAGPVIILVAGLAYLLALVAGFVFGRRKTS
jgi:zinc transport system permease protein